MQTELKGYFQHTIEQIENEQFSNHACYLNNFEPWIHFKTAANMLHDSNARLCANQEHLIMMQANPPLVMARPFDTSPGAINRVYDPLAQEAEIERLKHRIKWMKSGREVANFGIFILVILAIVGWYFAFNGGMHDVGRHNPRRNTLQQEKASTSNWFNPWGLDDPGIIYYA